MIRLICLLIVVSLSWVQAQPTEEPHKRLLASIAPMHSLLLAMTQGLPVQVELLISPERSPHGYQFRPSDLEKIVSADYLLWVGADLESMLPAVLSRLPAGALERSFMATPQVTLLPTRDHNQGHEGHNHGELDAHLWLDVSNMQALAAHIYQDLLALNPDWHATLGANLQRTQQQLQVVDAQLLVSLAPWAGQPFIVFHDAYQYFERRYGLRSVAAVLDPGRVGTSLQRQFQLRALIREHQAPCVFVEPQFEQTRVRALVGDNATIAELDPLGSHLSLTADLHLHLLRDLATNLTSCLAGDLL